MCIYGGWDTTAVSNCKKCPRNDKGIKSTYDSSAFTGWMKENLCRNDLAEAGKQCRGSMKRDAAICFHHQDRKTKQIRQSSCDCLRKYDGGGERARGLVGAEVVKPTYTQLIQRFQLTLIIAVDESARFLHLSNFAAGDTCFCVNDSEPDHGQNHFAASCFPTKWGVTAKLAAGLTGGEGSDWISCHPTTLKANLKAADLSECIQTDIRERLKYGENLSEIFD